MRGSPKWLAQGGPLAGAVDFEGCSGFLEADSASLDFRDSIGVSMWIRRSGAAQGAEPLLGKGSATWRLLCQENGTVLFAIDGLTVRTSMSMAQSIPQVSSKRKVNDGQWHHVAAIYDGRRMALYVDGQLEEAKGVSGRLAVTTDPLWIGRAPGAGRDYFNGMMDDIRLFDRALTEQAINDLHSDGVSQKR